MKTQLLKVFGLLILVTVIFSSCDMAYTSSDWNGFADGAKVPAALAIASGDTRIMLECLSSLQVQLNESGLSDVERGNIALDMIDLLAVLSRVMIELAPYLLGNIDPVAMSDISDFFESADDSFLEQISDSNLMEYGFHADPAPLQVLWSIMGLIISVDTYPIVIYGSLSASELNSYNMMIDKAIELEAEGNNPHFEPLLNQFRSSIGEI